MVRKLNGVNNMNKYELLVYLNILFKEVVSQKCERCINHDVCNSTRCYPRNEIRKYIEKGQ